VPAATVNRKVAADAVSATWTTLSATVLPGSAAISASAAHASWIVASASLSFPGQRIIRGAHVVHVTSDAPELVGVSSSTPTVRRRSSGSPTVRDVEGQ